MQGGKQMSWNQALPPSRQEDLKGLIRFIEKEWVPNAQPLGQEDVAQLEKALGLLKKIGNGETFSEEEIFIRCRNQDSLGYNALQIKINDQELEIAQIFKFLSENGLQKKRDRLYYLSGEGHCENYLGVWNGIWDILSDMRRFLESNNWKLSVEHKQ
jgi:hypothetical protein